MAKNKSYIVALPLLVTAKNKREAQATARQTMVNLNQGSADCVKGLIPMRNVVSAYAKNINLRVK
jgi:hypothetical protein